MADRRSTAAARQLATACWLIAIVGGLPVVVEFFRDPYRWLHLGLARWEIGLLLLGLILFAYAVYLLQIPSRVSVRVVATASGLLATVLAILTGAALASSAGAALFRWLELQGAQASRQTAGWCVVLLCLLGLHSYVAARVGARWREVPVER